MITVFTPTYNRAYRLTALYDSLGRQTCKDFEWIIVDDGSQDNTKALVEGWLEAENAFPIRYFLKENGGKHTAINKGVALAQSDWFFIVDSDDYLKEDAVQKIKEWVAGLDDPTIAAVAGVSCYPDDKIIGQCGIEQGGYLDVANNERKKYRLQGDKAEVYRTELLKKYPFPVFPGERFLSEGAVWDRIALDGYRVRWFNHPLKVCEYLPDGLTSQLCGTDIEIRSFEGCTYYTQVVLQAYHGIDKIRIICQYINKARKKGLTYRETARRIDRNIAEILLLSVPVHLKNWFRGRK